MLGGVVNEFLCRLLAEVTRAHTRSRTMPNSGGGSLYNWTVSTVMPYRSMPKNRELWGQQSMAPSGCAPMRSEHQAFFAGAVRTTPCRVPVEAGAALCRAEIVHSGEFEIVVVCGNVVSPNRSGKGLVEFAALVAEEFLLVGSRRGIVPAEGVALSYDKEDIYRRLHTRRGLS